jgi:hypothetical protein
MGYRIIEMYSVKSFIRHFEEEQIGKLFDIIAVADAVIPQDIAVVPQALGHDTSCPNAS